MRWWTRAAGVSGSGRHYLRLQSLPECLRQSFYQRITAHSEFSALWYFTCSGEAEYSRSCLDVWHLYGGNGQQCLHSFQSFITMENVALEWNISFTHFIRCICWSCIWSYIKWDMDPCLQYSECSLDRYMEKDFRKRRRCFLKSFLYVNLPENLAGLFFDGTDRTPTTESKLNSSFWCY